jgi:hypothetical protein
LRDKAAVAIGFPIRRSGVIADLIGALAVICSAALVILWFEAFWRHCL